MTVTREMIGAGHDVTMKQGIVLSWETLRDIYLSMDALANRSKTYGSPWIGLTNAERLNIAVACGAMDANWIDLAREIEDALLEKNS